MRIVGPCGWGSSRILGGVSASDHLSPVQFLFHVSPSYNKESILEKGLNPHEESHDWPEKQGVSGRVYLSSSEEDAYRWGEQVEGTHGDSTRMSLFKVDVSNLPLKNRKTDIGLHEYSSKEAIDPSRLSHVEDFWPHEKVKQR